MRAGRRRRAGSWVAGFTFVEVLAAMLFMAILVPVVVEGLTLANRAAVRAERGATALELADRRLAELQLNQEWVLAEPGGEFGEDWPGYCWELKRSNWDADEMVELTVTVFYEVQGRPHSVSLSTLAADVEW